MGFSGGSVGKESTCNVGDLGLIPGWEEGRREKLTTPVFWSGDSMRSSPAVSHNTVYVILLYLLTKYVILSMCLLTSCLLFLSLGFSFFTYIQGKKKRQNLSYLESDRKRFRRVL